MIYNLITELFSKLKDGAGNIITSTDLGGGKRGLDVNLEAQVASSVKIRDKDNASYEAKVDGSGNIYTITPFPEIPVGKTYIGAKEFADLSGIENHYTLIPNGETVYIQIFQCGSEYDSNGGSVFSLYYAPDGMNTDDEDLVLICARFANGNNAPPYYPPKVGYVGTGADINNDACILMRCEHIGGGSAREFEEWQGYY